ncbi:biotin/lipoyl-binding protein [Alcanivorax sp. IO_7]|nr:biotin/lipoyl-binding protein [Alcanivorax sp. IO_7]
MMLGLVGCEEPAPKAKDGPVPVKLVTVDRGDNGGRRYPGRVMATERSQLAFRVSGQLVELPVKDGQRVEEGQLLARLDPRISRMNWTEARRMPSWRRRITNVAAFWRNGSDRGIRTG